jgi:hypothetical protein
MSQRFLPALAMLLLLLTCTVASANTITIAFDGVSLAPSPFVSHTESGFTVSNISGNLFGGTFGHPPPFIYFVAGADDETASIAVTAGGSAFRFVSIDLYSSITTIPYTFTGLLGGSEVFLASAVVPNTFGDFATVPSPNSTALIDTLQVTLTNPFAGNPVGLDNIVVESVVPEPASTLLIGAGILVIALNNRIRGARLAGNVEGMSGH